MKQSSARRIAVVAFLAGLAVHVLFLMPFMMGILTDVPPIPYRWWNLASNIVNWFFIACWAVAVPYLLFLATEKFNDFLLTGKSATASS